MKIYLIAGEASGDLHGANLLKALHAQQPGLVCRAWGGDLMQSAGATIVKHYSDLAFMGFLEVAKNLRTIFSNIAFCKRDLLEFQPDVLVLIDYPGFNLRIARWAKAQGIRVVYYISPQLWAWHASRAHAIRRDVDHLLVILPFEQAFFKKYGIEAEFVGHPLLDVIHDKLRNETAVLPEIQSEDHPIIALLPGSRKQEVARILPRMLEIVADFPAYTFVVAGATSLQEDFYAQFLSKHANVRLVRGHTYAVLRLSEAALVKSGTSTLEAALLDVPQVVCYAGSPISYQIARRLVKVPYISLVNLIMEKPLVRELIQTELNRENLRASLAEILTPSSAATLRAGYAELRRLLGDGGASARAAKAVLKIAKTG